MVSCIAVMLRWSDAYVMSKVIEIWVMRLSMFDRRWTCDLKKLSHYLSTSQRRPVPTPDLTAMAAPAFSTLISLFIS